MSKKFNIITYTKLVYIIDPFYLYIFRRCKIDNLVFPIFDFECDIEEDQEEKNWSDNRILGIRDYREKGQRADSTEKKGQRILFVGASHTMSFHKK